MKSFSVASAVMAAGLLLAAPVFSQTVTPQDKQPTQVAKQDAATKQPAQSFSHEVPAKQPAQSFSHSDTGMADGVTKQH